MNRISSEQAHALASVIFADIAGFISQNREEFEAWCREKGYDVPPARNEESNAA